MKLGYFLIWGLLVGGALAEDSSEVKFRLALAALVDPGASLVAEFDGAELSVKRGKKVIFERRLVSKQRKKIEEILVRDSYKKWSGFYFSDQFLDGYMIRFNGSVGKKKWDLNGFNAGPTELKELLSVVDEIIGKKTLAGSIVCSDKLRYESMEAHMKLVEEEGRKAKEKKVEEKCGG